VSVWEERWHPLREEWVILAAHRQNRPWIGETVGKARAALPAYVADCTFCPGNKRISGRVNDSVTRVDPARTYAVRCPTAHPIYEHFRVRAFAELLSARVTEPSLSLLGEWMYQSHASYSACGLGSDATDLLVDLVRAAGPAKGSYGAKITGGGSGGTVAVLGRQGADIGALARAYAERTGHAPRVFTGSSPGAASFGTLRVALRA
jgi:galactokinase